MGDDGRALGDEGPQAAGMVEMLVRVDDVPDRLVRNQLLGFLDDRERSRFTLRPLDDARCRP